MAAEEESQRYKVGKFILETKRTMTASCWEFDAANVAAAAAAVKQVEAEVEFDSQDEDECEDLFAGVWTPKLALRRRALKVKAQG